MERFHDVNYYTIMQIMDQNNKPVIFFIMNEKNIK